MSGSLSGSTPFCRWRRNLSDDSEPRPVHPSACDPSWSCTSLMACRSACPGRTPMGDWESTATGTMTAHAASVRETLPGLSQQSYRIDVSVKVAPRVRVGPLTVGAGCRFRVGGSACPGRRTEETPRPGTLTARRPKRWRVSVWISGSTGARRAGEPKPIKAGLYVTEISPAS